MSGNKPKPEKEPGTGRFVTGNIGGGRSKGSRNKLGEAFIQDMQADWEQNGPAVITQVRTEKPDVYLKVVASILPQQLNVRVSEYDELTDDQINKRIDALARALKLEIGTGQADGGEGPPEARKSLN